MPYASIEDLPKNIQEHLPLHAQEIYRKVFNNAWAEYSDEQTAFRVAWAAVKKQYEKGSDGFWRLKEGLVK